MHSLAVNRALVDAVAELVAEQDLEKATAQKACEALFGEKGEFADGGGSFLLFKTVPTISHYITGFGANSNQLSYERRIIGYYMHQFL